MNLGKGQNWVYFFAVIGVIVTIDYIIPILEEFFRWCESLIPEGVKLFFQIVWGLFLVLMVVIAIDHKLKNKE